MHGVRVQVPEGRVAGAPVIKLVQTWVVVGVMVRDGCTEEQAKEALYHWSYHGRIVNYGGTAPGSALWDLYQVRDVLGFTVPTCPGTISTAGGSIPNVS